MTYSVKEIYYTCRARARRPDAPRCSCALPAAICGAGWKKTAPTRPANSAIPILSAPMGPAAASSPTPRRWRGRWRRNGRTVRRASLMSSAPAASRCCNWTAPLIAALHAQGFEIGIETNGTLLPPPGIDWICVSPKADAEQKLTHGDELKLVYPQAGAEPERFAGTGFHAISSCSRWTMQTAPPTPRPPPPIAWPIRNGGCRCRPTS